MMVLMHPGQSTNDGADIGRDDGADIGRDDLEQWSEQKLLELATLKKAMRTISQLAEMLEAQDMCCSQAVVGIPRTLPPVMDTQEIRKLLRLNTAL